MKEKGTIGLNFKDKRPTKPIRTVEITSSCYEHLGLSKGCLAVGEARDAQNGDFVALVGKDAEYCKLGFFNARRDKITLRNDDRKPQILDAKEYRVMRVITGYCKHSNTDKDGNLIVEQVNFSQVLSA